MLQKPVAFVVFAHLCVMFRRRLHYSLASLQGLATLTVA